MLLFPGASKVPIYPPGDCSRDEVANCAFVTVYIAPDGALSYTVPHSASIPQGSDVAVFGRSPLTVGGKELVLWTSSGDFVACPTTESGEYQVFVKVQGFAKEECTLIMIRTRAANSTSSWEY